MNPTLPNSVQELMRKYEAKREAQGLRFTPPDEKVRLGDYAFAGDVISQIMIGVATGVLVHLAKELLEWSRAHLAKKKSAEDVVNAALKSAHAIEDGIHLLDQQGVRATEARAAMELLKEAISESVLPKERPPSTGA